MSKAQSRTGGFLKQESGPEAKKLLDELIRKNDSHKLKRLYNVQDDQSEQDKEENFYERLRSKVKVEGLVSQTKRMAM